MSVQVTGPALSTEAFQSIRKLIFSVAGISMTNEKEELVRARLLARLRELKIPGYDAYLERIRTDDAELSNMVDVLTTNKTSFFREEHHFDFLHSSILPNWRRVARPLRVWSAGCSSGEEPYSLAMFFHEHLPGHEVRLLATDLSLRVLVRARAGAYSAEAVASIPPALRAKYLRQDRRSGPGVYTMAPEIASMVAFARLNLMEAWPMQGQFDLILCRNVMIYFNDATRTTLVRRFAEMLAPRAHLFIGHAESLAALDQPLRAIQPAVYAL